MVNSEQLKTSKIAPDDLCYIYTILKITTYFLPVEFWIRNIPFIVLIVYILTIIANRI